MSLETDALAFQQRSPNESVSAFACRYPGQYGEAAAALREVRKAERECEECDGHGQIAFVTCPICDGHGKTILRTDDLQESQQ